MYMAPCAGVDCLSRLLAAAQQNICRNGNAGGPSGAAHRNIIGDAPFLKIFRCAAPGKYRGASGIYKSSGALNREIPWCIRCLQIFRCAASKNTLGGTLGYKYSVALHRGVQDINGALRGQRLPYTIPCCSAAKYL